MRLAFMNRTEAGLLLAKALEDLRGQDAVILALPRGGVPVGFEIARRLELPLDVLSVRKLGMPGHEELALGAIASGGGRVLNEDLVREMGIPEQTLEAVEQRERAELERREQLWRGTSASPPVGGRIAVVVDDGLATGATARAALHALEQRGARERILAIPIAPASTVQILEPSADRVVCLATPEPFWAVGYWYLEFEPVRDARVRELLEASRATARPELPPQSPPS